MTNLRLQALAILVATAFAAGTAIAQTSSSTGAPSGSAPSAGSSGSAPCARASAMTTGTTIFAEAVFEVASETSTAQSVAAIVSVSPPPWGR